MRTLAFAAAIGTLVVACASSDPPPPQQPQASSGSTGNGLPCGVRLFSTPACQIALDQLCCPIEIECGKDPACVGLAQCIYGCKGKGDNCSNRCALDAQYAYCNSMCAGKGGDCTTMCVQSGNGGPVLKWALIANCSKDARYPKDVRCSDGT